MSYTVFGNTLNTEENNTSSNCTILTSSSAPLNLAATETLEAAYLYWSGVGTGDLMVTFDGNTVTPDRTFSLTFSGRNYFAAMADVTPIIAAGGNKNYTLEDFDLTAIISDYCTNSTNFGGWGVIVVYEDLSLPLNSVKIYDGLQAVGNNIPDITIDLDNILVVDPLGSKMGFIAWEGDEGLANQEFARLNGNALSNGLNPANNQFNGTNTFAGTTTLFNMDLDFYDVASFITPGDQLATVTLGSAQDFVMINAIPLALNNELPDPTVDITRAVNDDCDDRVLHVDFDVKNEDATDFLPAGTPIRFYVNNFSGVFLGETFTTVDLQIDESESLSIDLTIPASAGTDFDLFAIVNVDSGGDQILLELNPNNNEDTELVHIIEDTQDAETITICDGDSHTLIDGTVVSTAGVYTATDPVPNADNCDRIVTTTLVVNPLPVSLNATDDECSNNGNADFDLTVLIPDITGGAGSRAVTFHNSLADAENDVNPISSPFTTSTTTIFARVENTNTTCFDTAEVTLTVNPNPEANDAGQERCSDSTSATFDLSEMVPTIEGAGTGVSTTFHSSLADAETGASPLPINFTSVATTVFARVEVAATNCFKTSEIELTVNENPEVIDVSVPLVNCSGSATAEFDLTLIEDDVSNGATDVIVTFYATAQDAIDEVNPLPNPYNGGTGTVHSRVEKTTTGCFSTGTAQLEVINNPEIRPQSLETCSDSATGSWDLSTVTDDIINGVTNVTVTYHRTLADANAGSSPLPTDYSGPAGTIFARSEAVYQAITCHSVSDITLIINPEPLANVGIMLECSGATEATFDLSTITDDITGGLADRTISFHPTRADAENDTNPILAPITTASIVVFSRVVNTITNCVSEEEVRLTVGEIPVFTEALSQSQCFKNGIATFTLGLERIRLESENPTMLFNFYPTEADARAETNPLPDDFESSTATIFVQIKLISNGCFIINPMEIETIETPVDTVTTFFCKADGYLLPSGITVFDSGIYDETLQDPDGCDFTVITDLSYGDILFPSAFTPNGNGENDCFKSLPGLECIGTVESFELKIYNRWGEVVWTADSMDDCWSGDFEDSDAEAGFYTWWATYVFDGVEREQSGGVTLIR